MQDITAFLEAMRAEPYEEISVQTPHTGVVHFVLPQADDIQVKGPSGQWKEIEGTRIAELTRERNTKAITAPCKGVLIKVNTELEGGFVEAGTTLVVIRHYLTRSEAIERILRHALYLFPAPERAKYLFLPFIDAKVKASGCRSVTVRHGMELFIMTRMKREAPVYYTGPDGVIYAVYFSNTENIDEGSPLIGVCPADQAEAVEDIVLRIQTEWKERD